MNSHPLPVRVLCLLILAGPLARAAQAQPAAVATTSTMRGFGPPRPTGVNEDYKRMLDLLRIELPANLPPPDRDPKRPKNSRPASRGTNYTDDARNTIVRSSWGNWSNNDPAKASPYPLPDPLLLKDGRKVTDAETWWSKRRPEIVQDFETEMYGKIPANTPRVAWEVVNTSATNGGASIRKTVLGHIDNSSYPSITVPDITVTLTLPANASVPVPLICVVGSFGGFGFGPRPTTTTSTQTRRFGGPAGGFGPPRGSGPTSQQQVLALGWGYGSISTSVQADSGGDSLNRGIIGLLNQGRPRQPGDWGVLMAWAWSMSRAMDYLETDKQIDAKHVGLEGMSRWGKEALLAAAFDPRFALAWAACSGAVGAKPSRRDWGETVDNVAGSGEYHWMAGNFLKYGGNWDKLPVDSHELIALMAPRPVFVTGGTQDQWTDASGMFQACVGAGPVYRLLGKGGVGSTEMPAADAALISGEIGYRMHEGGHTDSPDWPAFLKFAQKYFPAGMPAK